MSKSKRNKVISSLALVLCLALMTVFVFAFAGCDDGEARGEEFGPEYVYPSIYDDPDEEYFNTSTLSGSRSVETAYVKNENAEIIDDFDDNGVATCIFRYNECTECDGDCKGHEMYLTLGGGVYNFYPYIVTIEDMADRKTEEMQVSLIFDEKPEKKDNFLNMRPLFYEIGSLIGAALDIENIELSQDYTYILRGYQPYRREHVADYSLTEVDTSTDAVKIYGVENDYETFGHLILSIETNESRTYEINFIDDSSIWDGLLSIYEIVDRDNREELQRVESENDIFEPSGDADENGVTEGIYYYDNCACGTWVGAGLVCVGHLKYRSAGGGFYDFYPYTMPLTLTDENGSTDINSKMQVSLVFDEEPEYNGLYYSAYPVQIEIVSLTGDNIEFYNIAITMYSQYVVVNGTAHIAHIEDGANIPLFRQDTSTATAKTFEADLSGFGTLSGTFTFETNEGDVYSVDMLFIADISIFDNYVVAD